MAKKKTNKPNTKRAGSILPLTAAMVVILLAIGLGLIRLGLGARMQAALTTAQISARLAADSGLEQAQRLMQKKLADELTWDNTTLPAATDVHLPDSDARFSYTVTGDPDNSFLITSTGQSGRGEKTVCSIIVKKSLWKGIGVKEGIDIKVGATFSTDPAGSDFAIRTNSTKDSAITLKNDTVIPGDVVIGEGGVAEDVISGKATSVIEGDVYDSPPLDFPPVTAPAFLTSLLPTIYVYQPGVPITGNVKFTSLNVPPGGVQTVVGSCNIYVTGDIVLGNNAEFIVASDPNTASSSLSLYVGGDLEAKNSVGIDNETDNPANLQIYGLDTCEHIDLKAKGDIFFGYVYAPDADLDVYAKNQLAGAFVANSFTLKNSTNFTYIPAANPDIDNHEVTLTTRRWWEP